MDDKFAPLLWSEIAGCCETLRSPWDARQSCVRSPGFSRFGPPKGRTTNIRRVVHPAVSSLMQSPSVSGPSHPSPRPSVEGEGDEGPDAERGDLGSESTRRAPFPLTEFAFSVSFAPLRLKHDPRNRRGAKEAEVHGSNSRPEYEVFPVNRRRFVVQASACRGVLDRLKPAVQTDGSSSVGPG
jgi:hypothetical protein